MNQQVKRLGLGTLVLGSISGTLYGIIHVPIVAMIVSTIAGIGLCWLIGTVVLYALEGEGYKL